MKSLPRLFAITVLTGALLVVAQIPVFADTYYTATFSGGVQWSTIHCIFDWINNSTGVSGNFVYDAALIPGPGTGLVNVFFDNTSAGGFPDVQTIPAGTLFSIHLGAAPLTFTFSDANLETFPPYHDAAIQYQNGNFNGFFFVSDFQYNGSSYRFDDEGRIWGIYLLVSGVPSTEFEYAYGYINGSITTTGPYTPPSPAVPLPATILLLGPALLGFVGLRKLKK
jgi:hypothetical protein